MPFILPEDITKPYEGGDSRRIYRRPFILNNALSMPEEFERRLRTGQYDNGKPESVPETIDKHDVFMGVAGFKSLDLLALAGKDSPSERRYRRAVLFDGNEAQIDIMREVLTAIKANETSEQFIDAFVPIFEKYRTVPNEALDKLTVSESPQNYDCCYGSFYQPRNEQELRETLAKLKQSPSAWLHADNYGFIRDLVQKNQIATVIMDLRDPERVPQLHASLKSNKLRIGHLYISSIMDFADPSSKTDYNRIRTHPKRAAAAFYRHVLPSGEDYNGKIEKCLKPGEMKSKPIPLTDKRTHFILSRVDDDMPILHSYRLEHSTPAKIAGHGKHVLANEKSDEHKSCSIVFKAGGQVWRLATFEGTAPNSTYYRVFSYDYPKNGLEQLKKQIKQIDGVIKDWKYNIPEGRAPLFVPASASRLRTGRGEPSLDCKLFDESVTGKDQEGKPVRSAVWSSQPYQKTVFARRFESGWLLNELVNKITSELSKERKPAVLIEPRPQPLPQMEYPHSGNAVPSDKPELPIVEFPKRESPISPDTIRKQEEERRANGGMGRGVGS